MKMLRVLLKNLQKGPATDPFPFGDTFTPKGLRGRVRFDPAACSGCRMCEHVCAAGAIRFTESAKGLEFTLWHNSCTFCGMCEHYCVPQAIHLTEDWHLAHRQQDKYTMTEIGTVVMIECCECHKRMLPTSRQLTAIAYRGSNQMIERMSQMCPDCRRQMSAKLLSKGASL
ncbi:4Fe-4S dicluster domain-containing protein [Shewanella chilikensis]|uniref:4Fe-4S ferredoxin n=1 Tax=Shewanella chilikensis TaxID=558541 RepID=A0A6G7LPN2_9GAMM|nr:4Fe-4S dicluster domain-containing protein [Shewanella chilikensis]QIJ03700.1 4Fe-4S ferredoxin [Shewanella chilikensis]